MEELKSYEKHYSEESFWTKLGRVAKKAGAAVVYAGLLLYYALQSPNTPLRAKVQIYGALGYLILPTDFIPDFIAGAGFLDDWGALALALKAVSSSIDAEVRDKASEKLGSLLGALTPEDREKVDKVLSKEGAPS